MYTLGLLPDTLAVCRLDWMAGLPAWAVSALSLTPPRMSLVVRAPFFSMTCTPEELSIVCLDSIVPNEVQCERGWRALRVNGPLDMALTGVLSSLLLPLAEAGISIFALSTYDTDYVLVRQERLAEAVQALTAAGYTLDASFGTTV